jgi:uncharacterized protein involved in exopolysaccharide biosynthesis
MALETSRSPSNSASAPPAPNAHSHLPDDPDDLDLGWYLRRLQRHWQLATAGALIGGALGFAYASTQPFQYEAVTTILVPANNPQLNAATFRGIAENASLASQIISELKLGEGEPPLTPSRFVEDVLRVEEVRGTTLVRVKVTLPDARAAAEASRALAAKAIALAEQVIPRSGPSTIEEQLQTRLNDAQHQLANAQQELMAHKQGAHADLFTQDSGADRKHQAHLLHLLLEIEGEDALLASAEAAIKEQPQLLTRPRVPAGERDAKSGRPKGDLQNDDGPPSPPANPVYETLGVQIAAARSRRAELYTQHDKLVSASKVGNQELAALRDLFRPQVERVRLQASVDLARKVRDDVGVRYEQVRAQPAAATPRLAVVDDAQPPDRPVSRRRRQHATYGAVAGLVLSIVLVPIWKNRGRRS